MKGFYEIKPLLQTSQRIFENNSLSIHLYTTKDSVLRHHFGVALESRLGGVSVLNTTARLLVFVSRSVGSRASFSPTRLALATPPFSAVINNGQAPGGVKPKHAGLGQTLAVRQYICQGPS